MFLDVCVYKKIVHPKIKIMSLQICMTLFIFYEETEKKNTSTVLSTHWKSVGSKTVLHPINPY